MSIKVTDRADKRNLICAQLFLRKGENKRDKGREEKPLQSLSGAGETARGGNACFVGGRTRVTLPYSLISSFP